MPLKVLITNVIMLSRTGTEIYVRDLALQLLRCGHEPVIYTSWPGAITDELTKHGIRISDDLNTLDFKPDVIHAHHVNELMSAILHYPHVPVPFICHDSTSFFDCPPAIDRVDQYCAVDEACRDRLINEGGIPPDDVMIIGNFVDLERFLPRQQPLPQSPQKALLFSNYAREGTHLSAVVEACLKMELQLDVRGAGIGQSIDAPEELLGEYDLVFAKAKAAMEAMAVGCAVVLCDFTGVGSMVTPENFAHFRRNNFGARVLDRDLVSDTLVDEIRRYDPDRAAQVCELAREELALPRAVDQLETVYQRLIEERKTRVMPSLHQTCLAYTSYSRKLAVQLLNDHGEERNRLQRTIHEQAEQISIGERTAVGLTSDLELCRHSLMTLRQESEAKAKDNKRRRWFLRS